jgi:hypothetical protein
MMYYIRESVIHAYLLGLYETLRWGSGSGMSHETNGNWNHAYDTGMNHAEWLKGERNFE